jgi:cell division protease FtsH
MTKRSEMLDPSLVELDANVIPQEVLNEFPIEPLPAVCVASAFEAFDAAEQAKQDATSGTLDGLSTRKRRVAKQAEAMGYKRPAHITPPEVPEPKRPAYFAPTAKPIDPIRTLGRVLTDRCLAFTERDKIDAHIFLVPSIDWCDAALLAGVMDAITTMMCGYDGDKPQFRTFMEGSEWGTSSRGSGVRMRGQNRGAEDDVVHGFWQGETMIGVCTDIKKLPDDLAAGADAILDLGHVDTAGLCVLILEMTGGAPESVDVPDWLAAVLTPDDYRMARRVGQAADDYLYRLILRAEATKTEADRKRVALERDRSALDDLHGAAEAVAWGKGLKADLAAYMAGTLSWRDVDKGALISGPPGCGKTTFTAKLALACGTPLVSASYALWAGSGKEGHGGELMVALRATFALARSEAATHGACILVIDELDSIRGRGTSSRNDDWFGVINNAILAELDGIEGRPGVVVLGLTNFPGLVDPAMTREGRLGRHITMELPEPGELAAILAQHLGEHGAGLDILSVTQDVRGSGADAEGWARGARRRARHAGRGVTLDDIRAELGDNKPKRSAEFARRIAVHEAGHAIAIERLRPGTVAAVSVRGAGYRGGFVEGSHAVSRSVHVADLEGLIVEWLAGRAAEEVLLGNASVSSGGGQDSDLAQATKLAANIELVFGGEGLLWLGGSEDDVISLLKMRPEFAKRTSERLDRLYAAALDLVRQQVHAVHVVADLLDVRDTLTGDEVRAAIDGPRAAGQALAARATHAAPGCVQ